ncbi:hypothetical protein SAMN05444366_0403 [Flavobacterium saccharophilum]|uniref:Uncharacterized protein n=1 Tax=Flavobacterium saccharophilum TaxID=29534 RepID=A0A1M6ZUB3_9FLAO|nr:hypothetical protein SAMN05444366_0403 [Flavobacterium saccharophilum]
MGIVGVRRGRFKVAKTQRDKGFGKELHRDTQI